MLIFIPCNYHTACLKTSLRSHLPCLNKIDSRSAPAEDKRAFRRDVNECWPLRRGLFVLWGGWEERKRERVGLDGKGKERREAPAFPLFQSSPARYSLEFLVGLCRPVPQILTRFLTKKMQFFHTRFQTRTLKSILVFRPGPGHSKDG